MKGESCQTQRITGVVSVVSCLYASILKGNGIMGTDVLVISHMCIWCIFTQDFLGFQGTAGSKQVQYL